MKYDELVKALRHCIDPDTTCDGCPRGGNNGLCADMLYREAADAIEALQAEVESLDESCKKQLLAMASHVAELQATQPHWVSVEDELPDDRIWVLVWHTGYKTAKKAKFIRYITPEFLFDGGGGAWQLDGWSDNEGHVTHWMPLPEPPQEVQE